MPWIWRGAMSVVRENEEKGSKEKAKEKK